MLVVAALLAIALTPRAARAEVAGEDLTISHVTFGPGTHPFLKFGHNAILVEVRGGPGVIYNFGMFDFSSALIPKFILGRSHYWLARTERDRTFAHYVEDDRTVEVDELALTPAQRKLLFDRLEENARPQNRAYLYDYFYDNCSTRVRDALDAALGGRLRQAAEPLPARLSYRAHALRLVADLTWEYVALYYALGLPSDRVGSRWDEGFIPMELRDFLRTLRVPVEGSATDQPLVRGSRLLYRSTRPPEPRDPPRRLGVFLALGLGAGGLLALLGWLGRRARAARVGLASLSALLGLVGGLLGALLLFFWFATNHRVAHANANVLMTAPWALLLPAFALGTARGRPRTVRKAFLVAATAAGAALFGLAARLTGLLPQDNGPFAAVFLPTWAGMAAGFWALLRGAHAGGEIPEKRA